MLFRDFFSLYNVICKISVEAQFCYDLLSLHIHNNLDWPLLFNAKNVSLFLIFFAEMTWCLKVLLNLTMLRYFGAIVAFIYWRKLDKSNSTFASRAFQTERIIWIHLHDIGFRTTLRWPCERNCETQKIIINVYFCCCYYIIQIHEITDLMLIRTSFIPNE